MVVCLGLALAGCSSSGNDSLAQQANAGGEKGYVAGDGSVSEYAPEQRGEPVQFEAEMFDGSTVSAESLRGKPAVVNFWYAGCAPCRAEVDDLQQVHEHLQARGDGTVLGINVRDPNPQIALDFLADNGVTYPSIYDPPFKTAANLGGVPSSVIPTTIVLDQQHRPAAVFLREITADDLLEVIDRLDGEA